MPPQPCGVRAEGGRGGGFGEDQARPARASRGHRDGEERKFGTGNRGDNAPEASGRGWEEGEGAWAWGDHIQAN